MNIDKKLIENVAKTARLNLSEDEKQLFIKDFESILKHFSVISELDTKNIHPRLQPIELKNKLRKDEVKDSLSIVEALSNAKHTKDNYFKGPKAI